MARRLIYNPAFDGVRAVAIISVVGFHWQLSGFWGGFFGVDVFFVLSGFLITTLLAEEVDRTATIRIGMFYLRRVMRLGPQLMLMLAAYLILSPLAWPTIPLMDHAINAAIAGAYLSDYGLAFWGRPGTLPHTWSLAVEEHYYLIWPIALLGFIRLKHRRLLPTLVILYVATTAWRIAVLWFTGEWAQTYSRFDTRLSGLMLGAILALFVRRGVVLKWYQSDLIGAASLVVLVTYIVTSNEHEVASLTWRLSIVELAAAGLILALAADADGFVARIFQLKPLVFIGLISYGLYLWHNPLWFGLYLTLNPVPRFLISLSASVALASASYFWIERPMRDLRHSWKTRQGVLTV